MLAFLQEDLERYTRLASFEFLELERRKRLKSIFFFFSFKVFEHSCCIFAISIVMVVRDTAYAGVWRPQQPKGP